jgi:fructose transport system permease protein
MKPTSLVRSIAASQVFGPAAALLATCIFFSTRSDRFLMGQNISLILQQVMVVGVLAIGQTLVALTGGIDLSIGMIMSLCSIVMTKLAAESGLPPALAILCGLAVGTLCGAINGALVTRVKIPAFIVTLGTMNIAFAANQIYSHSQTISDLPAMLTFFGDTFKVFGTRVTFGTVFMLVLYALIWFYLSRTAPGRHIYAVGNDPEAARLTGIFTNNVLMGVYTLAGFIYGIAGLLLVARTGVGDPQAGGTENLDSVTAVVLGGTSLFGGRGIIVGTLIGAIIVGVIRNGLILMGVPSVYQVLITGILVILAVATDQLSRGIKK